MLVDNSTLLESNKVYLLTTANNDFIVGKYVTTNNDYIVMNKCIQLQFTDKGVIPTPYPLLSDNSKVMINKKMVMSFSNPEENLLSEYTKQTTGLHIPTNQNNVSKLIL